MSLLRASTESQGHGVKRGVSDRAHWSPPGEEMSSEAWEIQATTGQKFHSEWGEKSIKSEGKRKFTQNHKS